MRKVARLFGVLLLLTFGSSAEAETKESFDLRYGLYVGGLHIADARLIYAEKADAYRSELSVRTTGFADALARYRGNARTNGQRSTTAGLRPETYTFRQSSRRASRTADVTFDPKTRAAVEAASTKRGEPERIEVPEALRTGVVDPLTAFLQLRRALGELTEGGDPLTARIFDGRRLYDVHARLLGHAATRLGGREVSLLRVELQIEPIAGFDEGDEEAFRLQALLSNDGSFLPVEVRTLDMRFTAVFRLDDNCLNGERCTFAAASG